MHYCTSLQHHGELAYTYWTLFFLLFTCTVHTLQEQASCSNPGT
uniref:Uncharacterized protein n=1 Tax=Anguilla anguilla TaxID=7936 RepID=A0A0E9RZ86_ANGAN